MKKEYKKPSAKKSAKDDFDDQIEVVGWSSIAT